LSEKSQKYAPNTRETVRRYTVQQFLDAGLAIANPDHPERPVNSPKAVYQIEAAALELLRTYGGRQWKKGLRVYPVGLGRSCPANTRRDFEAMLAACLEELSHTAVNGSSQANGMAPARP
jgi:hypothetical protein